MITLPEPMVLHFKQQTGSTNDDAIELAHAGAPDLTVVWALSQTKGRGRLGRQWHSTGGNLHWTCLVRFVDGNKNLEGLAFLVALAVGKVVRDLIDENHRVEYKWPNDVLVDDQKISGTLIEGGYDNGWVVIGVGINLSSAPDVGHTFYKATCMRDMGSRASLEELCQSFSGEFLERLLVWRSKGFQDPDRQEYRSALWRTGKPISVTFDAQKSAGITGINRSIDENFNLVLEMEDGSIKKIYAGDVILPNERS